jgi:hypothetical protein
MNTLILHTENSEWSPLDTLISLGGAVDSSGGVVLHSDESWIRLFWEDDVIHDYEGRDAERLAAHIHNQSSFVVEWRGDALLQKFLDALPTDRRVVLDNDHGIMVPFDLIRDQPVEKWIRQRRISEIHV